MESHDQQTYATVEELFIARGVEPSNNFIAAAIVDYLTQIFANSPPISATTDHLPAISPYAVLLFRTKKQREWYLKYARIGEMKRVIRVQEQNGKVLIKTWHGFTERNLAELIPAYMDNMYTSWQPYRRRIIPKSMDIPEEFIVVIIDKMLYDE